MLDLRSLMGEEQLRTLKRKREESHRRRPLPEWAWHAGLFREEGGVKEYVRSLRQAVPPREDLKSA